MQKIYSPQEIEQYWYTHWEKEHYFLPNSSQNTPYSIVLPPPNVTGTLHMGHGFQVSLMDVLIRYHRMQGNPTLWQMGTDHAGIATQMVVERQLTKAGQSRQAVGREAFISKTWAWKEQSGQTIKNQLRRMGASLDWSRERFSLDPSIHRAVNQVFITLYEEGLIYRGKRLVNWDPVLQTAISDLEVISQEEQGFLWYIRYPLNSSSSDFIIVATTRPETLLGDVAVAVHPEDSRYQHLIGQQLQLPLTDRTIPIIADSTVDPTFGTGCVKITPAHDFNDYLIGQRHKLPLINILTPTASIHDTAPEAYRGLTREVARTKIVEALKELNLLEKREPHTLRVPRGDRSGAIIEPYLTDQWYIHMKPLAEPALEAVRRGDLQFVPENWSKTYIQWLENMEDWCISRQLWWGHRIPVWYDEQGQLYVGENEAAVRATHQLVDRYLRQDEDVLDTWFSASLWPFATLGWPETTPELETFYPTSVLVTGFDILFFWVARMVMMGLKFTGKIPFKTVYITGLIRDSEGQKMSKSKGNILDPIDLIDGIDLTSLAEKRVYGLMQPEKAEHIAQTTRREFPEGIPPSGTDALRFTYCALANTGRDIRFDVGRLAGYRHFCNKLWNAARYVLMATGEVDEAIEFKKLSLADRWILSKLQQTIQSVVTCFEQFRFDLLAQTLYEFTWNEYCDWYLEFSKPVLTGQNASTLQKQGTQQTLIQVLEILLRLIHPIMPFITEEIWQQIRPLAQKQGDSIMLQPYPVFNSDCIDLAAIEDIEWLKKVILSLRQIRSNMNLSPKTELPLLLRNGQPQYKIRWERNEAFLKSLTKLGSIEWIESAQKAPPAAIALVDDLELLIPLEGLIDKSAELSRLKKESSKLQKEQIRLQDKLNNPNYLTRAPADIVGHEQMRLQEIRTTLEKIEAQKGRLDD